jgi:hypothetical protein
MTALIRRYRMTQRKLWAFSVAAASTLIVTACNNDALVAINNNPNSAVSAPAGALYTNAVRVGVSRWLGIAYDQRATSLVAQHLAEVQYPQSDNYSRLAGGFTTATYDGAYSSEQEDLQKVYLSGKAAGSPYIYGPAAVMRTWGFGYITDTWGDVPYFQALAGDSTGGALQPVYDSQKDIYADFFKVLDQATKDMATAPTTPLPKLGSADPLYNGSMLKYERFSNSLRARFAMRLVNVDPVTAQAQFVAAVNAPGGLFASNADNAKFNWPGDGVYDNPWAANFKTRDDHRISDRLLSVMQPYGDPRVPVYAQPIKGTTATYVGLENALTQDDASAQLETTSRPSALLYPGVTAYGTFGGGGASYPSYLMTYAEVSFLLAEAAERGWIAGSAAAYYTQGIRASMEQWGVTDAAAIATFLARPEIAYQGGTPGQIQIATQKWIALFTDGGQAWAEWRRTCQPAVVHAGPEAVTNEVIRRFQYSATDNAVNKEGQAPALSRQGADVFLTRMYWDTKPNLAPTYPGASCGKQIP